ncbi:MAG: hypothetical protein C4558_10140 [Dehalococcoidia bacterium]|nr:MAG: hypothetical protein C4558_10140 [Dehalococcoidia bacterium]
MLEGFVARMLLPPIVIRPAGVRAIGVLAILLAIWTDILFHRSGLGINVPIWVALLSAHHGRRLAGLRRAADSGQGRRIERGRSGLPPATGRHVLRYPPIRVGLTGS